MEIFQLSDFSLENVAVSFAPDLLGEFDNRLSGTTTTDGEEEAETEEAKEAEERMDFFDEFANETMVAEEVGAQNS